MNDEQLAHVPLAAAIRRQVDLTRQTKVRVLATYDGWPTAVQTDDEALHDFRVSLRRIRTFLRAARIIWNSKRIERIEAELRFYARQTGALRDDEVLRDTLASIELPQAARDDIGAWLVRRAKAARATRTSIVRLLRNGPTQQTTDRARNKRIRPFDRVLSKLDELLSIEPSVLLTSVDLARRATLRAMHDVTRAAHSPVTDVEAMHSLRIREKRLRYTAELFTSELGEDAQRIAKNATRMQRRLGELHDVDDALAVIKRARGLPIATQQATIAALQAVRAVYAAKLEPHLLEAQTVDDGLVWATNESLPTTST